MGYNSKTNAPTLSSPNITITGPDSYSEIWKTKGYESRTAPAEKVDQTDENGDAFFFGYKKGFLTRTVELIISDTTVGYPKSYTDLADPAVPFTFADPITGNTQIIRNVTEGLSAGEFPTLTVEFDEVPA